MVIPIRRVTATEAIVESLKERIQTGEFGPGDRLPSEQFMLREYDVSRLTLREALARLAALGIIRVRHGKGAFIKSAISVPALDNVLIPLFPHHDLDRMNDLVEARNMIESEIAAKVAEKRTEKQILHLESLLEHDANVVGDSDLFAERDYTFHLALAETADNQFLLAMYQALYSQIRAFLIQYARSIEDREEALERHRPILKAIVDRDVETARSLARKHAGICASYVKEIIGNQGVKP
ncbi:MAG: FadR family transcriptional regulator [Proteobacteria bacterium]|nr:FadR family transcriptional regulator [Pseudomonadota bacterium]